MVHLILFHYFHLILMHRQPKDRNQHNVSCDIWPLLRAYLQWPLATIQSVSIQSIFANSEIKSIKISIEFELKVVEMTYFW